MATPQFHLADLFELVAEAVPDRPALIFDSRPVSYREMNARAGRLASALAARGIGRGDKIGLYLMNGPAYLETFFAACKLGAIPFNVNYRYGAEELTYLFTNADAAAIVHDAEFAPIVEAVRPRLPLLRETVAVGGPEDAYGRLVAEGDPDFAAERAEDDYLLLYTGGTTGMPKGVMWPHKAFFYACLGGGGLWDRSAPIERPEQIAEKAVGGFELRVLPVAPLMHGAAIWTALSAILAGMGIVLDPMRSGFSAEAVWDRVEADKVNVVQIVGDAMAVPLIAALKANPGRWDLSALFNFGSGGAVFSRHLKDEIRALLPNVMVTDGMGASETGVSGMAEPVIEGGFMRLPADERQWVIVDGRRAEPGETGFLARTGHTPIGYYGDPVKTAETFQTIGGAVWVVSGDAARLDHDGKITLFGRGSTCINTGGEKVFPEEVEEALRAHPAIADAAVVGLPDPRWGEIVAAVVSLHKDAPAPSLEAAQAFCKERLAGYKAPRRLAVVAEIRRSPAGKQNYVWARSVFAEAGEVD